jgi:hypothetical protein
MSALILAAILMTAAQEKPSKEQIEASAKKIKELRKERITTLKEAVDVSSKLAQSGRLEVWEAMEDRMALLKAELEAAEKESDRIALYKQAVASLKDYEAVARARFNAGRGTELPLFRIKAKRLEVEIQLEQATVKESK